MGWNRLEKEVPSSFMLLNTGKLEGKPHQVGSCIPTDGGEHQPVLESHRESEILHGSSSLFAQTLGFFEVFGYLLNIGMDLQHAAIFQTVGFVETGRETTGRFSAGHLAFRAGCEFLVVATVQFWRCSFSNGY